ncbi:MAG: hypothetical protein V7K87_29230 [Nostoc sp.]
MVDECHLLWGDICGYVWGKTSERISVPVVNARDKQTYFGAIDYKTHEFLIHAAKKGDSQNTINFLEYLQSQRPGANMHNNLGWCKLPSFQCNSRLFRLFESSA